MLKINKNEVPSSKKIRIVLNFVHKEGMIKQKLVEDFTYSIIH